MFWKKKETRANEERNPDGLTRSEFIEQYKGIPTIAAFCWWAGIKPEELKEELKKLMND